MIEFLLAVAICAVLVPLGYYLLGKWLDWRYRRWLNHGRYGR